MKKILGLDLGTNSIGWALVEQDFEAKSGKILGMGSRIIPMQGYVSSANGSESKDPLSDFASGNGVSKCKARTDYRGHRRLYERHHQRRERLHRVLNVLGFLPEHYAAQIDFDKHLGQFLDEKEPKIAWKEIWNEQKNKNDFEFIFQNSFAEMVEDFKANGQELKIPYDWTIYYLRKKALTHKLEKEELAWLILNFNQKRGYYQLRGEDDEKTDTKEYCALLKVVSIEKGEKDKKNDKKTWYKMTFENGWEYSATFQTEPNWLNTEREFLITEEYDENGNIKIVKDKKSDTTGKEKRRITPLPSFDEINLMSKEQQDKIYKKIKARTEITISNSNKTVGQYIYETLLENPTQKIRGKLVRTIERKFYKDELRQILKKQIELQPELFAADLYNDCVRELYRSNETQQTILSKRDFVHLFLDDIIFYQRPLRSQKSSIGNCSLEYVIHKINKKDEKGNPIKNVFEKDANGNDVEVKEYLKGIPKSNPYYQEFRVWQWLYNLKIYQKEDDKDVSAQFIENTDDWVKLFDFLMGRKEIEQKPLIQYLLKEKNIKGKSEAEKYRWNYVEDKKYPCNETGTMIKTRLAKVENAPENFLTPKTEYQLWHIIYSVTDKIEFEKALKTFATKRHSELVSEHPNKEAITAQDRNDAFVDSFVENFKKFPPFKSDYGSFSEKAIKKLLPLMRLEKYWSYEAIDEKTKERISKIITGEYDETIKTRVREKAINLTSENDFQGLQLWLAQYVVYNRHSEADNVGKWHSIADLEKYLKDFKQHSLRNPIVEQVVTETLRVVRDIWKKYGKFDEIHVELGREMKNTAEDRAKITNQVTDNENTNLRIKMMLMEFANDDDFKNQKDYTEFKKEGEDDFFYQKGNNPVRPYSQTQHDILKIFEEYVLNDISKDELEKETGLTETKDGKTKKITYKDISQKSSPSNKEVEKYKLWLEQKYSSPYTGQMIPLSKLFTPEYQIEHIIPKSRYFDDSLNNKVICEAAVNQLKDKQLGLEFIKNHKGQKVDCGMGKNVEIFTEEAYTDFVKEHYKSNNAKRRNLLLEDIPDKMIARQMNDTRYISKFISNLLSNIVREETDDDGINSKNLISVNGKITTILKQDWGLNEIWNSLILPRFERMNELTQTNKFIAKNSEGHTIPAIPLELSKGFQKKRIDHRHHAMDALVIACATRDHVNYLNNQSSHDKNSNNEGGIRYDLKNKLCFKSKTDEKGNYKWIFKKPWGSEEKEVLITTSKNFVTDAKEQLEKIVVSFKQNLRVINKATNKYEKIKNDKKEKETQKGTNWAIRKPLHKETVYAKISLRKVKSVRLSEALKNWQSIVDKTLKDKIKQIITQYGGNASAEMLNKYFKDRKYQLNGVDISKVEVYYFETDNAAVRKSLDKSFTEKTIKESVTDTGIQKILLNHLAGNENNPELAFSPEGIENMNKNIVTLNDGKFHQPIYKVRVYETIGNKFPVGTSGNKSSKFVEAAKGTNLFFAVYADKNDNRNFETIPLNIVIERLKQGLPEVPETNEKGHKLLFHLSPNDLVYVPTVDEKENNSKIDFNNLSSEQLKRIYKLTDTSGTTANFIQANIAEVLFNLNAEKQKKTFGKQIFSIQNEIGVGSQGSKNPKAITGETIKEICIKLKIDRLGNINPLIP